MSVPWRQHFANSSFSQCLRLSIDFLADSKGSCYKTVLLTDHNSASFYAHILLKTIQDYTLELLRTLKELKIHFADSLILFRNLIKEKHAGLTQYDGSFVIIHQEVLYKQLFGTEFQGHHALEDVKAKSKFLFRSSLQLHLYLFPKLPTKVAQPTLTQPSQI